MTDRNNRTPGASGSGSAVNTPSSTPRLATSVASPLYFSTSVPQQQLSSPLMLVQQGSMVQPGLVSSDQLHSVRSPAPTATLFPVAHPSAPQYRLILLNPSGQVGSAAMGGLLATPAAAVAAQQQQQQQQQLVTAMGMRQPAQSFMQATAPTLMTANQQTMVMPISSVSPVSGLNSPPIVFSPHPQQQQQQQSLNMVANIAAAAARATLPQQIAAAAAAQTNAMLATGLRMFANSTQQNAAAAVLNHQQTLVALSAAAQQQQQLAAASRQYVLMPDGRSFAALPQTAVTTGFTVNTAQPIVSSAGLPFVCFTPTVGPVFPSSAGTAHANILAATTATRLPTSFQQQQSLQSFNVGNGAASQQILLTPVSCCSFNQSNLAIARIAVIIDQNFGVENELLQMGASPSAVSVAPGQRITNVTFSSSGVHPTTVNIQQAILPDGRRTFINTNAITPVSSPPILSFVPHQQQPQDLSRSVPTSFLYQPQLQMVERHNVTSIPSTLPAVSSNSAELPRERKQSADSFEDLPVHPKLSSKRSVGNLSAITDVSDSSSPGKKPRTPKQSGTKKDGGLARSRKLAIINDDLSGKNDGVSPLKASRAASVPVDEARPRPKPQPIPTKPVNADGSEETDADRERRLVQLRDVILRLPPQQVKWLLGLQSSGNLSVLRYLSHVSQLISECDTEIKASGTTEQQKSSLQHDLARLVRQRAEAEQFVSNLAQPPEIKIRDLMHPNDWQRLLAMLKKVSSPDYSDDGDNALTAEELVMLEQYEFYIKSLEVTGNHPKVLQKYFESNVSINDVQKKEAPATRRRRSGSSTTDTDEEQVKVESISTQRPKRRPVFHVFVQLSRSSTATLRTGYPFRLNAKSTDPNASNDRTVVEKLYVTQIEPDAADDAVSKRKNRKSKRKVRPEQHSPYKAILMAQVHVPLDAQQSSETFNEFVETVLYKFYSKSVPPGTLIRYRYSDDMIDETISFKNSSQIDGNGAGEIKENLDNVRKIIWDPVETCWREIIILPDTNSSASADKESNEQPRWDRPRTRAPPLLSGAIAMPRVLQIPPIADRLEIGQVRPHSIVEQAMEADYETLLATMCGSSCRVMNGNGNGTSTAAANSGANNNNSDGNANGTNAGISNGSHATGGLNVGSNSESVLVSALRSEPVGATLQNDVRRVCEPFWLVDAGMENDSAWLRSVADRVSRRKAAGTTSSVAEKKCFDELTRAVELCETRQVHCARQLRFVGQRLKEFDLQLNHGVGVLKTYRRRRPERVRKAVKKFEVED